MLFLDSEHDREQIKKISDHINSCLDKEIDFVATTYMEKEFIKEAIDKRNVVKPEITNQGTVTRCPDCGAIQFKVLPNVDIQFCSRCGKALDFSGIDFGLYYDEEVE